MFVCGQPKTPLHAPMFIKQGYLILWLIISSQLTSFYFHIISRQRRKNVSSLSQNAYLVTRNRNINSLKKENCFVKKIYVSSDSLCFKYIALCTDGSLCYVHFGSVFDSKDVTSLNPGAGLATGLWCCTIFGAVGRGLVAIVVELTCVTSDASQPVSSMQCTELVG